MMGFFVAIVVLLLLSGSALGSTWRCGQELIKTGDSSAEVLLKCGKPSLSEEGPSIKSGSYRDRWQDPGSGDSRSRGTFVETRVRVEHWYYDRGMSDFIYKLTFIGGVLANIKTLGYGGYLKADEPDAPSLPPAQQRSSLENQSTTGRIDIAGGPPGAKVYLNDFYTCNLPCIIEEVDPGSYNLTVRHEDYNEWRERILVKADSTVWLNVYLQHESTSGVEMSGEGVEPRQAKELFKWTDKEGRVHITDGPPPASEQ